MDILIQDNKAHYIYSGNAPEMHPDVVIVRGYTGQVEEGWLWDGSTFTAPVMPEPEIVIPSSISMRQCRLQLLADGLLDTVNNQVSAMDQASQISWEYATDVNRSDPLTGAMQIILGLNDAQMDAMFLSASRL